MVIPSQAHTDNHQGYSILPQEGVFRKVMGSRHVKTGDPIKLRMTMR